VSERLRADAVAKTWRASGAADVPAVRGVTLAVAARETVVVVGPSGSGKTTLLAMLGGLLRPDAGRVLLDGEPLSALAEPARRRVRLRRVGFVFQRGLLVEHLSAHENVALVARAAGVAAAAAAATALLDRLGVAQRAAAMPAALSPGEAQRVAVARALVTSPAVVLADEPTAHLDAGSGARVVRALRDLAVDAGAALVVVTHDERLVALADRVLRLEDGRLAAA
jgi:putative ABC transport system ATP-binding protein